MVCPTKWVVGLSEPDWNVLRRNENSDGEGARTAAMKNEREQQWRTSENGEREGARRSENGDGEVKMKEREGDGVGEKEQEW